MHLYAKDFYGTWSRFSSDTSRSIKHTLCQSLFLFKPMFVTKSFFLFYIQLYLFSTFQTQVKLKVLNKAEHVIETDTEIRL